MSLNRSVPQQTSSPKYTELVKFLIQPFLENPNSLSVDCEVSCSTKKVWIRVAFEGDDKGRVYGRGGRNIQAIRTAIAAAGAIAEQSIYLDIYGGEAQERNVPTVVTRERVDATLSPEKRRTTKPNSKPRSSVN